MERWAGKVAVVTGASVGIGAAVVKKLLTHNLKVIGCARNFEQLQENAKDLSPKEASLYIPVKCDVTKEEDIKNMFKVAQEKLGGVHVLVNNAGVAVLKSIMDASAEEMHRQTDVNVVGLTLCAKEAINQMRQNGVDDGHVINVRALNSHIRVSQISPGLTTTEFVQRAMNNPAAATLYQKIKCLSSEEVADAIVYALSAPRHIGIHEVMILPVEEDYVPAYKLPEKNE